MPECTIEIRDEVNCKIHNLDLATRRECEKKLKYFMPHAYHTPAYKLGRWDGCVSYFTPGGGTYINMLDNILDVLEKNNYTIDIKDKRTDHSFKFPKIDVNYHNGKTWPEGHVNAGADIVLRDYQVDIINQFLEQPQCLQEVATGAGKTIITATLSNLVEPYGRTIVVVPNKDLVTQTFKDYENLGLDVGVYFGDKKDLGKTHTICTWQSLNVINKKFKDAESDLSLADFAEDVVCIIIDEVHQAKADVLKQLLTGPFASIPLRFGLTGTVPKDDWAYAALKASIGPVSRRLGAAELQDKGVLAECQVNVIQLEDNVVYNDYQSELKFLTSNSERMDYLAKMISNIKDSGNTLVLVDRIKAGDMLLERLGDECVFVSGSTKSKMRQETYADVQTADGKVIVATYGVASVGINIPRIFNLVLVEPGKSFVRVIQSIGRGIRKAEDKEHVEIWDIASTAKFSKRHLTERKKFYNEARYPFTIKKMKY